LGRMETAAGPSSINNITLDLGGGINDSFESGNTTVTEEEDNLLVVGATSEECDEAEEVPVVRKIHSGRVRVVGGVTSCMIRLTYEETPGEIDELPVYAAVLDDAEYKVICWVIKNKSNELIWREQITEAIERTKNDEVSFFGDWIDWEYFVQKVEEENGMFEKDGGGKPEAGGDNNKLVKKPNCVYKVGSPLKNKKKMCTIHDFVPETNKKYARKGSGWCLDEITCEGLVKEGGVEGKCGKEFVEDLKDAKEGNGIVVSSRQPAYWCKDCNLVLCHMCYSDMCVNAVTRVDKKTAQRCL
jgi:hypothetical protein